MKTMTKQITSGPASDHDEIMCRAVKAYYSRGNDNLGQILAHSESCSGVYTICGRTYAVISNSYRTLAVYRVCTTGQLRRMRRWPAELNSNH